MKEFNPVKLFLSVAVSLLAGAIGSIFTFQSIPTWYATINKPFFTPPNEIFGPVWTALYILMGTALYIIWQSKEHKGKSQAYILFFSQLVLNTIWSILFFGLKSPFLAFVEIIILLLAILITAKCFYQISKIAGLLFVPYILWVTFASLLNFAVWILNS